MRTTFALLALFASGCITHLPLRTTAHRQIRWAESFDVAVAEATRSSRPIVACLAAGELDGLC
jgi:hypothetical protein